MAWYDNLDVNVVLSLASAALGYVIHQGWKKKDTTAERIRDAVEQAWMAAEAALPAAHVERLKADARNLALSKLRRYGLKNLTATHVQQIADALEALAESHVCLANCRAVSPNQ